MRRSAERGGHARRWPWLLAPALLFLALHLPALDYEFVWTDQGEIEHGILIRPPGEWLDAFASPMHPRLETLSPGAAPPYYRPLQIVVASAVDHALGRRPAAFRAVNYALALTTLTLFWLLALRLLDDPRAAALAAGLVAAHPAGIEDYVWIAGLGAALTKCLVVLSLLAVPRFVAAKDAGQRVVAATLSCLALAAGLLAKESAAVTPALSLAVAVTCVALRRREDAAPPAAERSAEIRRIAILVGAQSAIVAAYLWGLRPAVLGQALSGTKPIAGDPLVHLLTVVATWPDRLAWIFLPLGSTTNDVVPVVTSPLHPSVWLGAGLALAAPWVWLRLLRLGRPLTALGWAWLWIAFLPTSGLVPLTHVVAVRYVSFSVFGAALMVVDLLGVMAARLPERARPGIPAALGALLVAGLAVCTGLRLPDWQSDLVLFEREVTRHPEYREGYYVLAVALIEEGRYEEAQMRLHQLQAADAAFEGRWSFLREGDAILMLCRVNLVLGVPEETLPLFGPELQPGSALVRAHPALLRCGADSLHAVGRVGEANAIRRALGLPEVTKTSSAAARHLIFVSLDTARADMFGFMGNDWIQTPRLDALAEESIVFSDHHTVVPTTLASHTTLFTGRYPHHHGTPDNGYMVHPDNRMLAEILRDAGFRTAGVVGSFALESRFDFDQGFEHFDERFDTWVGEAGADQNQRNAAAVTDAAIGLLDEIGDADRLFLFVHYFDPHRPYTDRGPFMDRYRRLEIPLVVDPRIRDADTLGQAMARRYAGEISYLDHHVGRLLTELELRGIFDDAIVVLTCDHGENFAEHGEETFDHGITVYEGTTRVLWTIRLPRGEHGGRRLDWPTSSVDVLPTLLRELGIEVPPDVDGRALPLRRRQPPEERPRFSQATRAPHGGARDERWPNLRKPRSIRRGPYKLIQTPEQDREALYELTRDPHEMTDLLREPTPEVLRVADGLRTELEAWAASADPLPVQRELEQARETLERLEALGYVVD